MKIIIDNKGFTLLEVLIYTALLALLATILTNAILMLSRSRGQVVVKSEINQGLRFAAERIKRDVSASSTLITPAFAGATSSSLVLSNSGANITYCVADYQLRRQAGGACNASSEAITGSSARVGTPVFTRLENPSTVFSKKIVTLEIRLSASSTAASPDWQYGQSLRTTIDFHQDF
ncbi:prepilin-type N-terminal cleavage/methylation domain-containing protein [Candidatus Falkowbacteria bacterium]|nr:prepilin-type N-terminal cleavage/methylation domain-containing protein [Candidatus Falkowbacteria bacterium]